MTMDEDAPAPAAEPVHVSPSEDANFLARVIGAAGDRDGPLLRRLLKHLDPADLADVIEHLPSEATRHVIQLIGAELPAEMLAELSWETREEILPLLPTEYVGRALGQLDTDDAAAVAADVDEKKLGAVLAAAPEDVRLAVEEALSFDEETAGRLMQREYVAAPEGATVGEVIDRLRADTAELPDIFFEVYVVDATMRPIGAAGVSTLLRHGRDAKISEIMKPIRFLVRGEMDQEDVAQAFVKYHLASAPVIDESGRLTGMVTVDDIVDVLQEEGEEDMLKLAGVNEASQTDTVFRSVRARAPWLVVNLVTAIIASSVIAQFSAEIQSIVALAVLMPIVASMGGNAGTQTLAVAVRAMASRELSTTSAARYVLRESVTGIANGLLFAGVLAAVAGVWFHSAGIALAIGLAVIVNLTAAGMAGILVPLGLRRMGADPAVSSGALVTFVTDCVGFLAFLGFATLILL